MTERQRATSPANAAKIAVAGMIIAGGALAMAGQAGAEPVPYPTPVPAEPGAAPPPGQPVVVPVDAPVDAPPPPPPVGPPTVPEIANPVYGSGKSGSGPLASLRDIWHEVRDGNSGMNEETLPDAFTPPPGAGPAPKLPPGYTSLTDPASSTPASPTGPATGGPPLPPGYYPLNGPPPPGWSEPPPADPAAPPTIVPVPPTP
jgi:hypothetical protein